MKIKVPANQDIRSAAAIKKPEVKNFTTNRDLARVLPQKNQVMIKTHQEESKGLKYYSSRLNYKKNNTGQSSYFNIKIKKTAVLQ